MTKLHVLSPEEIETASRALISARKTNIGLEIKFPIVHTTGAGASVYVVQEADNYLVHDAGQGAMILASSGSILTKSLQEKFSSIAAHYGCEFIEGRMLRRCSVSQIPVAAVMVANASRTVGDYSLENKKRPFAIFKREMTEIVSEVYSKRRIREDEAVKSVTGTTYRVNAVVLDSFESAPIAFVEAVADDQSVNRHFREFYDLKQTPQLTNVKRVAIYDSRRVWRPGDLAILDEVGTAVPYDKAMSNLRDIAA